MTVFGLLGCLAASEQIKCLSIELGLRRFDKYLLLLGEKLIKPCELEPLKCYITSTGHPSVYPSQNLLPSSSSVSPVSGSPVLVKLGEG